MLGLHVPDPTTLPPFLGRVVTFAQSLLGKNLDPSLPVPSARQAAGRPDQRTILGFPSKKKYFGQVAPKEIGDVALSSFDPGVFNNELLDQKLYPTLDPGNPSLVQEPEGNIIEGTYVGTQLALVEAYSRIEQT
jgi:hypothetical protein